MHLIKLVPTAVKQHEEEKVEYFRDYSTQASASRLSSSERRPESELEEKGARGKMEVKESRGERLRALVNERQAALAQEMLALFERTVAELEEEVRVLKEENERQRQLLQSAQRNKVKPEVPGKKTGEIFNERP